jgi:hypothetical protein
MMSASVSRDVNYPCHQFILLKAAPYLYILIQNLELFDRVALILDHTVSFL